jgi:hypothetical protein
MALELNHYELNILMSALGALETSMCAQWERAQKASPYGSLATSVLHELAELRRVSELVNAEYHKPTDAFVASQEELYDNDFMVVS